MTDATVRAAALQDAQLLAELQIQFWQQAYSALLPADVLFADPARHSQNWAGRIGSGHPVLIAQEGAEPVGFAAAALDDAEPGLGAVEVLAVLPRWTRRGHGGRLLGETARLLRQAGATRGCWWAPEVDTAIASFLAGVGWLPDGHRRVLDTGDGLLPEVRYSGSLDLVLI